MKPAAHKPFASSRRFAATRPRETSVETTISVLSFLPSPVFCHANRYLSVRIHLKFFLYSFSSSPLRHGGGQAGGRALQIHSFFLFFFPQPSPTPPPPPSSLHLTSIDPPPHGDPLFLPDGPRLRLLFPSVFPPPYHTPSPPRRDGSVLPRTFRLCVG